MNRVELVGITERHWSAWRHKIIGTIAPLADAYAEIFFLSGKTTGLFFLTLTVLEPNVAFAGLIAVVVAYSFAVFIGLKESFFGSGYFIYNSLLVGFSIGYLFELTWAVAFLLAVSAILTFLVAMFTARVFYLYLGLPILSIPFTLVSSLIYLASAKFPNLYVTALYEGHWNSLAILPQWISGYLIALGTVIFMPNWISGLMIALVLLYRSRIIFAYSILGYMLGVAINSLLIGSWQLSLMQSGNFNYILIAIALGAVCTVPSRNSFVLAGIGVALATVIMGAANAFWSQYAIPIFTLPFIMATLSILYVLNLSGKNWFPSVRKATPEETLEHHLVNSTRFPLSVAIDLPFTGEWTVWQGFDGPWTHKGIWKYAYDFVITDDLGRTSLGHGRVLDHYYCYKKPVLSPVKGKVIAVVNSFPDNPIGVVDSVNNWGNYIILWDERGIYVEISHFAMGTISVAEGQWIGIGEYLGLCGNSGYSPEPHIHIQVQSSYFPGAHTIPFCFHFYQQEQRLIGFGLPETGARIQRNLPQVGCLRRTNFLLGDVYKYRVFRGEKIIETIEIDVRLEVDGTYYFHRQGSRLYFYRDDNQFRCLHMAGRDPYLKMLYLTACFIPFAAQEQAEWSDSLQSLLFLSQTQSTLLTLKSLFMSQGEGARIHYKLIKNNKIMGRAKLKFAWESVVTQLILDDQFKFKTIEVNDCKLERFA